MHYIFMDESYPGIDDDDQARILVVAWAVDQHKLNERKQILYGLRQPGRAPILKRIDSALNSLDAWAVMASADLNGSLYRPGEADACKDVQAMARSDNIWSITTAFTVAHMTAQLDKAGQQIGTVDIYHDPKSLRGDHRSAWEKSLQKNLVSGARRFGLKHLKLRYFNPVSKEKKGAIPNKFQLATWVAHKICSESNEITRSRGTSRIKVCDMSDVVRKTVQQWDGKAYDD